MFVLIGTPGVLFDFISSEDGWIKFKNDTDIFEMKIEPGGIPVRFIHDKSLINKYLQNIEKRKKVPNPINSNNVCTLINTRKDKFYKYLYDGESIANQLKSLHIDRNRYKNCCNCVSYVIYIKNDQSFRKKYALLDKYISCLYLSALNAKHSLSDWVIRIYLDISVYRYIDEIEFYSHQKKVPFDVEKGKGGGGGDGGDLEEAKEEEEEKYQIAIWYIKTVQYFKKLIELDNVEIYTYLCDWSDKLSSTRTLRFLPLIGNDTNIVATRDADGILTNLDCHNLKIFEKSDKFFYFIPWSLNLDPKKNDSNFFESYSLWLTFYKMYIEETNFFKDHSNVYDLLAGTFATKIKIKESYYYQRKQYILNEIPNVSQKLNLESLNRNSRSEYNLRFNYSYNEDKLLTLMYSGFDEMLLLDIFKEIILSKNLFSEIIYYTVLNKNIQNIGKNLSEEYDIYVNQLYIDIKYVSLDLLTDYDNYHDIMNIIIKNNEINDRDVFQSNKYKPSVGARIGGLLTLVNIDNEKNLLLF